MARRKTESEVGLALLVGFGLALFEECLGQGGVGTCDSASRLACDTAFLNCRLSQPAADQDAICGCAAIYYRVCLPAAGCAAAAEMISCVDELMRWDCPDMSVCGNDCTLDDGNPELPSDSIVLPVNNFSADYLQLSVCSEGFSEAKLRQFGQVTMGRCDDGGENTFRTCDLWVPPYTLTAVAFPPDVTYIHLEKCVFVSSSSSSSSLSLDDDAGSGSDDGSGVDGDGDIEECLATEMPLEYYGTPLLWPSSIDVEYSTATLCERDEHCPGSFCDLQQQPRTCAPKLGEHFSRSGSHFLDSRWELMDLDVTSAV